MKGRRYLIDLDLIDKRTNTGVRASDYVYVHESDSNSICFPDGFQWHKRAVVHIIVPVKNGGRWALYFIRNIAGSCSAFFFFFFYSNKYEHTVVTKLQL